MVSQGFIWHHADARLVGVIIIELHEQQIMLPIMSLVYSRSFKVRMVSLV